MLLAWITWIDDIFYNFNLFLVDSIYPPVKFIFMNCPLHYQLVYGYGLAIMWRKFLKNKNNENYFNNEVIIYLFCLASKVVNYALHPKACVSYIIGITKNAISSLIDLIGYLEFKKIAYEFNNFKNKTTFKFWRPVFKKYSYLGIFSFLRSKWYKKK